MVTTPTGMTGSLSKSVTRNAAMILASASVASTSEMRADADARACAERQISETIGRGCGRHEALGDERVRVAPQFLMPVQQPGCNQYHVVFADRYACDYIGAGGRACNQERRRIEAHGFVDHGAGELQPIKLNSVSRHRLSRFFGQTLLRHGVERQQIERPEQRRGGGLVTGQNHGRDLVAELFVGERLSRLGIACRIHQVEQIARRRARLLSCGATFLHQHADELRPAPAEARPGKIPRARPGERQDHVQQVRPCQRIAIFHHEVAQGCAVAVHPEREHGAPGYLERHPLHRFAQIDGCVAVAFQLGNRFVRHGNHVRNEGRDRARREGRRKRAPLVFPGATFGDQHALSKYRTEHAKAGGRARIILVVVDQHVADRVRGVENETRTQEEPSLDDVILVSALAPGTDRALAHRRQPPPRRHVVGSAWRAGGNERPTFGRNIPDFGNAHGRPRKKAVAGGLSKHISRKIQTPSRRYRAGRAGTIAPVCDPLGIPGNLARQIAPAAP